MNTLKKTFESGPRPFGTRLALRWALLFADSFFIVLGAVTPASKIPEIIARLNDKWLHAGEFFFLFWLAVYAPAGKTDKYRFGFAFAYCTAMAVLTETLQRFVPSRSASAADFFADAAGFTLSAVLLGIFFRRGK